MRTQLEDTPKRRPTRVVEAPTKKPKVKLYKDGENQLKGDGLCSYIKPESVDLALTILDGSDFEGKRISVQRAKFEMKGDDDPKLKPTKRSKKQIEKAKKQKARLFACGRGDVSTPSFGSHLNPISARGG